jgi:hypothetical protein
MRMQKRLAGIVLVAAGVLFATTAAFANPSGNYQIKLNARDQAAAGVPNRVRLARSTCPAEQRSPSWELRSRDRQ